MRVLGIDLAAQAKKTYACVLHCDTRELHAELDASCDDDRLRAVAVGCEKVAIDAPFGWPNEFVDALAAHRAGEPWPAPDGESPETYRASLSFRATDRVVMHTRRPLSVATDKLGVAAMRCAYLLDRWSAEPIDRSGVGRFVEVYPAGALVRWGYGASGYKGVSKHALDNLTTQVCTALPNLRLDEATRRACSTVDDAFDALVAALVARAAILGLTDGPPPGLRARAAQEGWIHLPVRGSLPLLGRSKGSLRAKPAAALSQRLREAGRKIDGKGYTTSMEDALLPTFSPATRAAITSDLSGKGGSELIVRKANRPKFYAAHSSAALAANTFGPFLRERQGVPIEGRTFHGATSLEAKCPTGLAGTPPTLDCLVDGPEVLAVESKCSETFTPHMADFKDAYSEVVARMHKTWREEYARLASDPTRYRYRYLDAAQLIKHYLGLRTTFRDQPVTLAYLYWTPSNAADLAPCAIHAAEVTEFTARVADPKLRFLAMPYRDLWSEWSSPEQPQWLEDHAAALRRRYDVAA